MKILIRLPNWLGDVVMSTAFIAAVKQLYPDALVDVIIKKELSNIATLITGINQIHLFSKQEFPGLRGVYRFGKNLRSQQYDLFFSLPDSISAATMGWATGAKKRIGFGKEGSFLLLTKVCKKPVNVHRVDEYLSMLEQFAGTAITERQVKLSAGDLTAKNNNRVLINLNSEAESRRMPLHKGIRLVSALSKTFPDVTFAFIGGPKDVEYVNQLTMNVGSAIQIENYAGKTDLGGLANLMAESRVLLTTDSGPGHLANSVGTPTIALFGAGNEHNTAPYNKGDLTVIRAGQLPCEPCVKNTCVLYGIPKCMELLDEVQIINAVSLYLNHV
jgi:lipopolysaccharide heptosyltransferase II